MEVVDVAAIAGVASSFMAMAAATEIRRRCRRRRSVWVKSRIMQRPLYGGYSELFNDLLNYDEASFRNFMQMAFQDLLLRVEVSLSEVQTRGKNIQIRS